jgi:hypothetical protein
MTTTCINTATGTPQAPKRGANEVILIEKDEEGTIAKTEPTHKKKPCIDDLRDEEALEEARLLAARLSFSQLWFQMTTGDLMKAGFKSRMIDREVSVGRLMHGAWEAFKAKDFEKAFALLREAAAKSDRHASKQDYKDAKDAVAKRELATRVEELVAMMVATMKEIEDLKGLDGLVEEEVLVEAAAQEQALEATIGAKIKASRDAIVAGLEGRWGKRGNAHKAIESFLIKGEEPKLVGLEKKGRLFELGEVEVYGRKRVTVAVRFSLPRSLNDEDNGAAGANGILYELVDGEWVPIAGSPVNKKFAATTGWYRMLNEAVNNRPDVKAYLRELLLGRFGATSPWYEALSAGKYKVVTLGHVQEHGASGFVLYQLATVVDEGMMTAELADKMAKIKANMTAGAKAGEAPRYFTISASGRA